jgi:FMN phosphatase YigB (HAD superfamily)
MLIPQTQKILGYTTSMIKAICFDLDGTLVHYVGDFQKLLLENARSLDLLVAHKHSHSSSGKYAREKL